MKKEKKKIFIHNICCPRRALDAEKILKYFCKNGYKRTTKPQDADMIFLITCSLFNRTEASSIKKIKEYQQYKAELVVGGCLPDSGYKKVTEIFNGKIISTTNINKIDDFFPDNKVKFRDLEDSNKYYENINDNKRFRLLKKKIISLVTRIIYGKYSVLYNNFLGNKIGKRIILRISQGCPKKCTYCIHPKIFDGVYSKAVEECIREFKKGLKEGYRYFRIEASDTGSYGLDIGSNLPALLDKITQIKGDYVIVLNNLNPDWLIRYIDDLKKIIKRKKISNIVVPIQSASPRILKLMKRKYDIERLKECFNILSTLDPEIKIASHFIVGFPTETDEDFQLNLTLIEELKLSVGIFFKFSECDDTPAANIFPKVSEKEMKNRMMQAGKNMKKLGYKIFFYSGKNEMYFDNNDYFKYTKKYL